MPDFGQDPWLFVQICRQWRAVALSDSRLWCSLNLGSLSVNRGRSISPKHFAAHIERSRTAPLSLNLPWGLHDEYSLQAFEAVADHWQDLELGYCTW
ncbi:hypothetical protein B0H10DRAFT_2251956, partial [Mycena sp. CBHHK59/15]